MPRLADVIEVFDRWFNPSWAESWDAVGLVCGDPDEPADRIVLAVDAVPATVDEALSWHADLLFTHHPLLLSAVHGVPANEPKGALVHRMIRGSLAHFVAHTNADVADPGVSDSLGVRLGLAGLRPLEPQSDDGVEKLVVFVPVEQSEALIEALAAAGAGALGNYDRCAWTTDGTGTFRPLPGAHPTLGHIDEIHRVAETRLEMAVPRSSRVDVIAALRAAHPYEEPAFDLLAQAPLPSQRGTGRIGELPAAMTLHAFTALAAAVLPATSVGIRAAGDPDRLVRTVAVCGGSGGGLAGLARRSGADVLLTADLKHHPALEEVSERRDGIALVDATHWASEAPWLDDLAVRITEHFGTSVEVRTSRTVTDPWSLHEASTSNGVT